jgi:hypothetical protein
LTYQITVSDPGHPREQVVGDRLLPEDYEVDGVPTDDDPRPAYHLTFKVIDGVPQCREVRVTSTDHGREVRRSDLQFAIEDYLEWATLSLAQPVASTAREDGRLVMTLDPRGLDAFRSMVRRARRTTHRRGPSDEQLREAAGVYRAADHAPTQAVADRFEIAHRTASLWIKRAREKGMLS